MREHRTYLFDYRGREVEFGPYLSEYEAKEAFQRLYGYWPAAAIASALWVKP